MSGVNVKLSELGLTKVKMIENEISIYKAINGGKGTGYICRELRRKYGISIGTAILLVADTPPKLR